MDSPCPIFTNVGPSLVRIVRSSTALARRFAEDESPLRSSSSSFTPKAPSLDSTSAALSATWSITQQQSALRSINAKIVRDL